MGTRKTKTKHEDAKFLCCHDQNLQCDMLSTGFRVSKLRLDNPSPERSGAVYGSYIRFTPCFIASKLHMAGANFSRKAIANVAYGRVPINLKGLCGKNEDHYGCHDGVEMS